MASSGVRAAEFSLLPSLDRPKTLVDEVGNDLPSTQQPKRQHGTASKPRSGWALLCFAFMHAL